MAKKTDDPLVFEGRLTPQFMASLGQTIDARIALHATSGGVAVPGLPIRFKRLSATAKLPTRAHATDAGIDLYADEEVCIQSKRFAAVRLGVASAIPAGFCATLWGRSGMAREWGVGKLAGVIDASYRGEWSAVLFNVGDFAINIQRGDKVVQALVLPVPAFAIEEVDELPEAAERGDAGFGSTGK